MNTLEITKKLNSLFSVININLFKSELQNVEITIAPKGKHNALGWFTLNKSWSSDRHEINICAEYLDRGILEVSETLIHEMVHLYNFNKNIVDCSRNGTFHNKKFKLEAEKRFLIVTTSKKYGHAHTTLSKEGIDLINSFGYKDIFTIKRIQIENLGTKKKSNIKKYVCPECKIIVRASKIVNVLCGNCTEEDNYVQLILEEVDEDL